MKEYCGQPHWDEAVNMMLPNIFYIQPYAIDLRYGREINKHIEPLPDDAWIVLMDYDTCWLTPNFGRTISNAIVEYGDDTDLFTCQTNRLGNPKRCWMGEISNEFDVRHHARIARSLERDPGHKCTEVDDRTVAGMLMIFPKRVWLDNKFDEHPIIHHENNRITSFDVRFTKGIKGSIKRIEGLYIFHYYRGDKNKSDISHLVKL